MIAKLKRIIAGFFLELLPRFAFPYANTFLFNLQGYKLHPTVRIFSTAKILGDISVSIGAFTFIGHETLIMGGASKITIGKNCDISSRVNIISGTHEIDMLNERSAGKGTGKDITIEDGVWIGFGATILPGATIAKKAIISAGSIVNKDIPAYTVAVGNPCKPIKKWNFETLSFDNIL